MFEKEYFQDKRLQVSIFMSPINVHVTRYPIGGKILFSKYHPGKYLVAWHPKASEENERTTIVVENKVYGKVLYRQIAGALAKRIVNYAKEGDMAFHKEQMLVLLNLAQELIFICCCTNVNVILDQKIKGGVDIIAH